MRKSFCVKSAKAAESYSAVISFMTESGKNVTKYDQVKQLVVV